MTSKTHILITGGNRGLGLGLVQRFLAAEDNIVLAGVRDPSNTTLHSLPVGHGSKLIIFKYSATDEQTTHQTIKDLPFTHLDIVISNAGIANTNTTVKDVKIDDIREHFEVNVIGSIVLFQATINLLQKSPKPAFIFMSSGSGSLSNQPPWPNSPYGSTKATINWFAIRANAENDWLNAFALNPGFVQTDMGNRRAAMFGVTGLSPISESADSIYHLLTTTTKEKHGGKFVEHTGKVLEW